jgi:hypothetical protein
MQQEEVTSGPEPQNIKRKETDQSVPPTIVNSEPQDKALKALTLVHQIMKELKGAASEEDMALAITKFVHRPLKAIAFNENGIARQRHELSKQLQDLRIDVALFSEIHLKPHDRFHIQNYHFYRIDRDPERKGGTVVAVRKGIPHMNVDIPPLISVEATGVCIPIGNQDILIAAVNKSPGRIWNDEDITELLSFRHKCILAGDLNAKYPSWNTAVSNPSGQKLLQLFDTSDFYISAPQCPTH